MVHMIMGFTFIMCKVGSEMTPNFSQYGHNDIMFKKSIGKRRIEDNNLVPFNNTHYMIISITTQKC